MDADAESYDCRHEGLQAGEDLTLTGGRCADRCCAEVGYRNVRSRVAEKAHEVAEITESLVAISNPNMKSDLTTAQALAGAAITGALANVEINLASLKDQAFAAEVRRRVEAIQKLNEYFGEVAERYILRDS